MNRITQGYRIRGSDTLMVERFSSDGESTVHVQVLLICDRNLSHEVVAGDTARPL